MNKLLQLIVLWTIAINCYSQKKELTIIKELDLFYTDTINDKIYFGSYEPTGAILSQDSSYIVSTILSIDFPERSDTTFLRTDFKKYYARSRLYDSKAHISSGSVFKLNRNFTKEWEIILKDRRITHIISLDSSSFIISGERVDQKVIWIAKLNCKDGTVIWLKEFNVGYSLSTCGLTHQNDNFYILGETEKVIPFRIRKYYGVKKREWFKETEGEQNLVLLCISKDGELTWKRKIDPQKYRNCFGYAFISTPHNHYILSSYDDFNFNKKKAKHIRGYNFYTLNRKGKIKSRQNVEFNNMFSYDTSLIFTKTKLSKDFIETYQFKNTEFAKKDSVELLTKKKDIRIQSTAQIKNIYYLCGSIHLSHVNYLICSMNNNFKITDYRTYDSPDYSQAISIIDATNNTALLFGWRYKTIEKTGQILRYINIIEFRKFGA